MILENNINYFCFLIYYCPLSIVYSMILKSKYKESLFSVRHTINCSGKILDLSSPVVMGILNITPDSFYDGGRYNNKQQWLEHTGRMLAQGASIIDIGAISTRPGAKEISEKEESRRLIPVISSVRKHFPDAIISVDTFRAAIAEMAVDQGASLINDISGWSFDSEMYNAISKLNVPYIIMHIKGTPATMQIKPKYNNLIKEIISYFSEKICKLRQIGVKDIILDPGFGFGKSIAHNFELLSKLDELRIFELPVLVGISRKSIICKVLDIKPQEALIGTTVLNTVALFKGAKILRVHDVAEAVQTIKLVEELKNNN